MGFPSQQELSMSSASWSTELIQKDRQAPFSLTLQISSDISGLGRLFGRFITCYFRIFRFDFVNKASYAISLQCSMRNSSS